jgi:RimJ/RimL family protein N-acetyltransferase
MIDKHFTTDNLVIKKLTIEHTLFLQELVNTEEWIKYIGDKNIHSTEDALTYINKILDNDNIDYWVVYLKEKHIPIGLISLIKRDYLQHHDLGFAFLPTYTGKGYAYEATYSVLHYLIQLPQHITILATTIIENNRSIALLKRLGFHFKEIIQTDTETLNLFVITTDDFGIDELYRYYFE